MEIEQHNDSTVNNGHFSDFFRTLTSRLMLLGVRASMRTGSLLSRANLALHRCTDHLHRPAQAIAIRLDSIRSSRVQTAAICFTVLLALPMAASMKPGVHVTMNGMPIGTVASAEALDEAVSAIERNVSALTGEAYILDATLDYGFGFATVTSLQDETQAMETIVSASDDLDHLSVLKIDGETIAACQTTAEVQAALDEITSQYTTGSSTASASFLNSVHVSTVTAPTDLLTSTDALSTRLMSDHLLDVQVQDTLLYTEAIPFDTITRENDTMDQNKTVTIQAGTAGEAAVTAQVTRINGIEQERTILSRAVLADAVPEVLEIGTKNIGIGTGSLQTPLTSYRFTSGFKFRGSRWHKGVDLCTPVDTPVYAADNGRVVVSEWSDSFGYYIIIDHQNGLKTLYAHNNSLIANVGDVLSQGDLIAMSGNTGTSSAPHVHFEVHLDGTAINPELYLTL